MRIPSSKSRRVYEDYQPINENVENIDIKLDSDKYFIPQDDEEDFLQQHDHYAFDEED